MTESVDLGVLFGAAADTKTFLGLDACGDLTTLDAPIAIIGAPCATPYASAGAYCRNGPDALRRATAPLTANVDHFDFDLGGPVFPEAGLRAVDCGNLPFDENDAAGNRDTIRKAVSAVVSRGAVPVLLGGDDSIPIPMIDALSETGRKYTIVQIDAHIDWRDTHMGETMGLSSTMRRASEMGHIERIIQVGARGIGSARESDVEDAKRWGASLFTAHQLDRDGLAPVLDMIPDGSDVIVCFDADALDSTLVPGVIARGPGGFSYFQTLDLLFGIAKRGRIAAMDFVEFMPERDIDGLGALSFARVITSALGILARQSATAKSV